ncbi:DUF1800 domain-containing protein [Actinosynnema sp. NPDC050801]|uniref:DUF1800 domain-containing protein n=1 Tax=unclassified Actinosynnema TaxID=2637065 RepID=UPI0033C0E4AA
MAQLTEHAAVRRLYDRLGFGPREGDLDRGFDAVLDALPAPTAEDPPPPPVGAPRPTGDKREANRQRAADERALVVWWLDRMVTADAAATERITWFWHGHFATSEQKVRSPALMLAQNRLFRRLGLGPFGPLAQAVVVDPAMLLWLDGDDNRAGSPNENLAREFLELFALGIGHYDEHDVREAARALTGWKVVRGAGRAEPVAKRHDGGAKTILGDSRPHTAASLVDLVLSRPESADFVVGRLWFRMVSAAPPAPDAVERVVAAFRVDTRSALRAIAAEPAFLDPANALVKQPVEWLVGLMRALGVRPAEFDEQVAGRLGRGLRALGQVPFRPPSVGGWPSGGAWLTTAAWPARLDLARLVADRADLAGLGRADPVEGVRRRLGVDAWSERTRSALARVADDPAELTTAAACAPEYVVSG